MVAFQKHVLCLVIILSLVLPSCAPKYTLKITETSSGNRVYSLLDEDVCIRETSSLKQAKIDKIGGVAAKKARDKNNPPTFKYAVIELEIDDFEFDVPPEIKVFDEKTDQLMDHIRFNTAPAPCTYKTTTIKVPISLAYDPDPWSN